MEMIAGRLRRLRLVVRTPTRSQTQQVAQSILISNHLLSISDCCNIIMHITITFSLQMKVANCRLKGGFIYMRGVFIRCPTPILVDFFDLIIFLKFVSMKFVRVKYHAVHQVPN